VASAAATDTAAVTRLTADVAALKAQEATPPAGTDTSSIDLSTVRDANRGGGDSRPDRHKTAAADLAAAQTALAGLTPPAAA